MRKLLLTALLLGSVSGALAQTGSLVREDRVWNYSSEYYWEWNGKYDYKMRFDGVKETDGQTYHKLIVYDGHLSWCDYPDPTPIVTEIETPETYLMREEDGKVYLHKDGGNNIYWGDFDGHEALLYNFNMEYGSEMEIITAYGLTSGTVTSTEDVMVDGENCKLYDMYLPEWGTSYTVVEGLGNITWGNLSSFEVDLGTGGQSRISLEMVTDLEGNLIYQSNPNDSGEFNSVAQTVSPSGITYDGSMVSSVNGECISLYTLSGKVVATGIGKVSTLGL